MALTVWASFLGFVVITGFLGAWLSPDVNAGFKDSTSVIVVVTSVAVGIERLIEMFWIVLGQANRFGGWWPLSQVVTAVATVEAQTNELLTPVFEQVQADLKLASAALGKGSDDLQKLRVEQKLEELESAREHLHARLRSAQTLAPGSSRFALITQIGSEAARLLGNAATLGGKVTRDTAHAIDKAAEASSIATTVVSSFGDNPARRLASVFLGAGAGMFIAGLMGLNLFAAVLGQDTRLAGLAGILATGVIVGLGSNPTHEIVKSLQSYKESRKPVAAAAVAPSSIADEVMMINLAPGSEIADQELPEGLSFNQIRRISRPFQTLPIRSTD